VLLKNISLVGVHWGAYTQKEVERISVVWKELLSLFASGRIKPVTFTEIYEFEQLVDGLAVLENRQTWGKAVVRVRGETKKQFAKL